MSVCETSVWDLCLRDVSDVRLRGSRVIDVCVSDPLGSLAGCPFAASSCAGCPGTSGLSVECLFTDCFAFEMSM